MSMKFSSNALFLTFLGIWVISISLFGFHYGWLDDVYFQLSLTGTISDFQNDNLVFYFVGLSKIMSFLYRQLPVLPWYGIFQMIFIILILLNLSKIYGLISQKKAINKQVLFAVFVAIYIAFILRWLIMPTFTYTGILLALTGLLSFLYINKNKANKNQYLFSLLSILLGFLIRIDTGCLTIVLVLISWGILHFSLKNKGFYFKVLAPLAIIGFVLSVFFIFSDKETKEFIKRTKYVRIYIDGLNFNDQVLSEKDSILKEAASRWFYYDEEQFNESTFKSIGVPSFGKLLLKSRMQENLNYELHKSIRYPKNYLPIKNWKIEILFLLLIQIGAIILSRKNGKVRYRILLSLLFIWSAIIFITVFNKMEDRVLLPVITCFIFLLLLSKSQSSDSGNLRVYMFLLLFSTIPLTFLRLPNLLKSLNQKRYEISQKSEIIKELNKEQEKIIVFDLFSLSILHQSLFHNITLDKSNEYIVWGESGFHDFSGHRNKLKSICNEINFSNFYECLGKHDDVIFVYSNQRADFIKKYALSIYNQNLDFVVNELNQKRISSLNYSFMWFPLEFNYYKLQVQE